MYLNLPWKKYLNGETFLEDSQGIFDLVSYLSPRNTIMLIVTSRMRGRTRLLTYWTTTLPMRYEITRFRLFVKNEAVINELIIKALLR